MQLKRLIGAWKETCGAKLIRVVFPDASRKGAKLGHGHDPYEHEILEPMPLIYLIFRIEAVVLILYKLSNPE